MASIDEVLINIIGDEDDARRALEEIVAELTAFGRIHEEAEADLDLGDAQERLEELRIALTELDHSTAEPKIKTDIAGVLAQIAVLQEQLFQLGARRTDVDIDVDRSLAERIGGIARQVGLLNRAVQAGAPPQKSFIDRLKDTAVNLGPFTTQLRVAIPLLLGLSSVLSSLVGGLAGLVASLAQAAAGFGALAVAAGGALVPVIALAVGAFQRFTNAKEAADQLRQAIVSVRQATQQQADAERGVQDAERRDRQAQQDLVTARRAAAAQARTEMLSALDSLRQSEENVQQAVFSQKQAVEDLTQARQDAARALVDERLAAQGAALSQKQAVLDLKDARERLRQAEEAGVKGRELKQLRLDVAQAELQVKTTREDNKRSQDDLNEAEKKGVEGSDQVVQAKQALVQANTDLADSNRDLIRSQTKLAQLERQQARTPQQVVAARRQLAAADRAVLDAERNLHRQTLALNKAQRERNQLLAQSAAIAKGTAARSLLDAAKEFRKAFGFATAGGADKIFGGIADALKTLAPTIRSLRGSFTQLGRAISGAFRRIGHELASPAWTAFFGQMIDLATTITPKLTDALISVMRILRNIASAAAPFLEVASSGLANWLNGLAESSSNIDELRSDIGNLVGQLFSWLNLAKQLGRVFINFTTAAAGPGQTLVDILAQGASDLADWLHSAEGQNSIRDFIQEAIPGFLAILKLVFEIVRIVLQLGQVLEPVMTPILRAVNNLLEIVNDIEGAIRNLPGPLRDVLPFIIALLTPWRKIFGLITLVTGLFGGFGKAGQLAAAAISLALLGGPVKALRTIGALLRTVFAGAAIETFLGGLSTVGGGIGALVTKLGGFSGVLRAVPWVAAGALVLEYADDVGKAAASLAGFSDEAIKATEAHAAALGTLADARFQLVDVIRSLNKEKGLTFGDPNVAGSGLKEFFGTFSQKQIDRMKAILARGGSLAGHAFIDNAVAGMKSAQAKFVTQVKGLGAQLVNTFAGLAPAFEHAGSAAIAALAKGMRDGRFQLRDALHFGAGIIRDLLPGSEPKDKSSPLTRLDQAGEAIIANIVAGIKRAAPAAHGELNRQLSGLAPALAGAGGIGDRAGGKTVHNRFHMPLTVVGGGSPDPAAAMAAFSRRLRQKGLSIA